ncbi:MAG: PPC domain-containing protein [Planctomycetaceae bacterium]
MKRHIRILLKTAFCLMLAVSRTLAAEPPNPQALFPSGVQRGQSATVKIIGTIGDPAPQFWTSRTELTAQPGAEPGTIALTATPDVPAGVYWVRLFNAAGASRLRPFIVGTLPEVAEVEPNNAVAAAQTIDVAGTVINGALDQKADVDTFRVTLAAGQTLIASLDADRTLGGPMDGILQLVSPQGFVIAQNDDDHGIDPQIVFTAPTEGAYAVRLFAFPKDPNSTIRFASGDDYVYRLTLTTGPFVDRVVPTTADSTGPYRLIGWNMPEPREVVPQRTEFGLIASMDAPGTWEFERLPRLAGTMRVESDPAAEQSSFGVPGAIFGALKVPGERDTYTLAATAGTKYVISVAARSLGSPLDAVLTIRNPEAKVIDSVDDSGAAFDPVATFTPASDGQYSIEVADRFEFGGERFFYVLTAAPEQPDFAVELEQDAYTLRVGEPLEVKLKVVRRGGMSESVTLAFEGLPTGVTAVMTAPVPDPPDSFVVPAGTDAVTLKLEAAEGTTYSGPWAISGSAGSERRSATAPLIELPLRTPHIWLTVAPKP